LADCRNKILLKHIRHVQKELPEIITGSADWPGKAAILMPVLSPNPQKTSEPQKKQHKKQQQKLNKNQTKPNKTNTK